MKMIFLLLFVIAVGLPETFAADEKVGSHALMSPEELALRNKAKRKLYPGGRDEEPLTVQEELPQAIRKIGPTLEAIEEDANEPQD